jgi:anti-sigma factor (TIGR02949 family)
VTTTELDCKETFRRLDDYVDRELAPDELGKVEAHLAACAMCADEFQVERSLLEGIRDKLRRIKAPPGLLKKIEDSLRAG